MVNRRIQHAVFVLFTLSSVLAAAASAELSTVREAELEHLLRHDCGSCHGMRLTGGLGPPLTAAALAHKSVDDLAHTVAAGRAGTAMPPWDRFLSAGEIRWLVEQLLNGAFDVYP
jgi:cytochrome c55X